MSSSSAKKVSVMEHIGDVIKANDLTSEMSSRKRKQEEQKCVKSCSSRTT